MFETSPVSRRRFVQTTAAVAVASKVLSSASGFNMMKRPLLATSFCRTQGCGRKELILKLEKIRTSEREGKKKRG